VRAGIIGRVTVTSAPDATSARRDRPGFRADIEGLRAVAILMVAVYHVWVGRVSGGVDVFLMISGFFVGASVVRSYAQGRAPSLWRYYAKVLGRLVPAAALVLATVLLTTWTLLPRTRMTETVHQTLASLFYYENWYLATTGRDYGAADPTQSMTQHFWSLSVQGQLFVALPLLLLVLTLVLGRLATLRVLSGVVVVLLVASFVYATWLVQVDQGLAYYSTAARAWQFLLGTVLALVVARGTGRRMPQALRGALGALGLVAVLATGVVVDGLSLFPGPAALLPLLGAAAIVLAGSGDRPSAVSRALAVGPLARAGSSAYGFYLWHWPLLVLVVTLTGRQPGWYEGVLVLLGAALLTWLTELLLGWRPSLTWATARRRSLPGWATTRVVVGTLGVVGVLVTASAWTSHTQAERDAVLGAAAIDSAVYPGALTLVDAATWSTPDGVESFPEPLLALDDWPARDRSGCTADAVEEIVYSCVFGEDGGARRVALVGGSHAVSLVEPLDAVSQVRGIQLDAYFKQGCPFKLLEDDPTSCTAWSANVLDHVLDGGYDAVVVTGTRPAPDGGDYVPASYERLWGVLEEAGVAVVAVRDNPWMPFHTSECLVLRGAEGCTVARDEVLSPENPLDAVVARLAGTVSAIDLSDLFCDEGACPAVIGNVQVYIDADHLTATFSRTLAAPIDTRLGLVTGWW
jgi:peptidoglycan/LPS O-acetylase OafA/YrhL